jgi:hypothetical protein
MAENHPLETGQNSHTKYSSFPSLCFLLWGYCGDEVGMRQYVCARNSGQLGINLLGFDGCQTSDLMFKIDTKLS